MRSEDASEPPRLPRTPNETLRELLNEGLERFQFVSASDIGVEELADWLAARGVRVPAPQGDAAPPLDRRLKRIADEMPALRDFIRAEHGPIGWEHTLNIWITDLQKITALRGGASSSGSAPDLPLTFGMPKEPGDDMGGQST